MEAEQIQMKAASNKFKQRGESIGRKDYKLQSQLETDQSGSLYQNTERAEYRQQIDTSLNRLKSHFEETTDQKQQQTRANRVETAAKQRQ